MSLSTELREVEGGGFRSCPRLCWKAGAKLSQDSRSSLQFQAGIWNPESEGLGAPPP